MMDNVRNVGGIGLIVSAMLLISPQKMYSQPKIQKGAFNGTKGQVTASIDIEFSRIATLEIDNQSDSTLEHDLAADEMYFYTEGGERLLGDPIWDRYPGHGSIRPHKVMWLYSWSIPYEVTTVDSIEIILYYENMSIMCHKKEGVSIIRHRGSMTKILGFMHEHWLLMLIGTILLSFLMIPPA
jgi:hypothetical protein